MESSKSGAEELSLSEDSVFLSRHFAAQRQALLALRWDLADKTPDVREASAVWAASPKVWANARTCPVHIVLGIILACTRLR